MTEAQLLNLVSSGLNQKCQCQTGGRCAEGWHTFKRPSRSGARVFVLKDHALSHRRVMLNFDNRTLPAFIQAADGAGVPWSQNDDRNVGWTRVNVDPRPQDLDFIEAWVRRTID